ncbi:hypothetical protein NOCA1130055 [metagenome]|uniref:Uncharacterized protein n=1 Tax=metagenome TaxID=256318 RepID=A0A2P2C665_9ZZZZ
MSDFGWVLVIAGLVGGLGGFLGRVLPGGTNKVKLEGAPTEVGAFLSAVAGAVAGVVSVLMSDDYATLVLVGKGADLSGASLGVGDMLQSFSVGLIGTKWLVNHQNGQTLREAVSVAASKPANPTAAAAAASSKPREVLRAAQGE